jgi:hypothetical protein
MCWSGLKRIFPSNNYFPFFQRYISEETGEEEYEMDKRDVPQNRIVARIQEAMDKIDFISDSGCVLFMT